MRNASELYARLYISHTCGSEELTVGEKSKASGHLALFRCLARFCSLDMHRLLHCTDGLSPCSQTHTLTSL